MREDGHVNDEEHKTMAILATMNKWTGMEEVSMNSPNYPVTLVNWRVLNCLLTLLIKEERSHIQ